MNRFALPQKRVAGSAQVEDRIGQEARRGWSSIVFLDQLYERANGCGEAPDLDDWVLQCEDQLALQKVLAPRSCARFWRSRRSSSSRFPPAASGFSSHSCKAIRKLAHENPVP